MFNFIIPCSPSHVIVPKYCHVGASLKLRGEKKKFFGEVTLLHWSMNSYIQQIDTMSNIRVSIISLHDMDVNYH